MAELLQLIDPEEVRAALDPTGLLIDATSLPTPTIARKVYAGAAVNEVLALDAAAAAREGDALQHITTALNLLTAANIAPFVVQITREKWSELDTTYQAVDWAARAAELRRKARAEVATVTDGEARVPVPQIFGLARGRRGR